MGKLEKVHHSFHNVRLQIFFSLTVFSVRRKNAMNAVHLFFNKVDGVLGRLFLTEKHLHSNCWSRWAYWLSIPTFFQTSQSQTNHTWLLCNFSQITVDYVHFFSVSQWSTVQMLPRVVWTMTSVTADPVLQPGHALSPLRQQREPHNTNPHPHCSDSLREKSRQTERGLAYFPCLLESCLDIGGSCGLVWTRFTCECVFANKRPSTEKQ